jgi:hypothetical protein
VGKGHGRRERRSLTSTTARNGYADRPGAGQVFRLVRERTAGGKTTTEAVYGVTSRTRAGADAGRRLDPVRGHWSIEDQPVGVRDGACGEDAWRVRTTPGMPVSACRRSSGLRPGSIARRGSGGGGTRAAFAHRSSGDSGSAGTPPAGAIPGRRTSDRTARFRHFATASKACALR